MDLAVIWERVLEHLRGSTSAHVPAGTAWLAGALVAAAAVVVVPPVWRRVRTVVTIVHELGHAGVGILCGRRFTGLVVSRDMSGHAVTAGRPGGPGLVATTAAGYPMPVLVGAGVIAAAMAGWAGAVLLVAVVALAAGLVRARSLYTVVALVVALAVAGGVWWWGSATARAAVVAACGVVLVVGGWRQLMAVVVHGGRDDDPAVLRWLTGVPVAVWDLAFVIVCAVPTWWALGSLAPVVSDVVGTVAG